jgi:hypothetical protein
MSRFILALSIGGLLWIPGKSSVKVDMMPSLFVMNAHGATCKAKP